MCTEVELLKEQLSELEATKDKLEITIGRVEDKLRELTGCDCAALGIKCKGHGGE